MTSPKRLSASLLLSVLLLMGCAGSSSHTAEESSLTEGVTTDVPMDFGGSDPTRWRPEAIVANAAARALRAEGVNADVTVAIPVDMLGSELFPYGDGQSNAAPDFRGWPEPRPPIVATRVITDERVVIRLRLDRALPLNSERVTLRASDRLATLDLEVDDEGDHVGSLDATSIWPNVDLRIEPFSVVPEGWRAGFAISFVHPTTLASAMRDREVLDRERISSSDGGAHVETRLAEHVFSSPYNQQASGARVVPYTNAEVHARFPSGGRLVRTAVGGGRTWVADDRPLGGTKTMYQCFDGRNRAAESAEDGGVPSGTGWHRVGDRAETVVNDLERSAMQVGFATRDVMRREDLGPDGFAWGLSSVTTVRLLRPGEALVTPRGTYHWFGMGGDRSSCAEIIVTAEGASLDGVRGTSGLPSFAQ